MAPEILRYIVNATTKAEGYTNAVDIWALGCIIYRLVKGTVPFPPGLSLVNFCGDETKFPSHGLEFSELGIRFIRDLLRAYPSTRLTAQEALDHDWITTGRHSSPYTRMQLVNSVI